MTWVVPPEWVGETVFILGCGPSLASVHTHDLRYAGRVIAINDSYLKAPWADVLYFCDRKWWLKNKAQVAEEFKGRWIVTLTDFFDGVKTLRCTGAEGLDTDPGALRHGSNSGYQAIHLAYHFGAKQIVLLGYDLRCCNGKVHWRDRAQDNVEAQNRVMQRVMLPRFQSLVRPLAEAGVKVFNATPNSALLVWPHTSLSEFLMGVKV